jgi:hypothetical protein
MAVAQDLARRRRNVPYRGPDKPVSWPEWVCRLHRRRERDVNSPIPEHGTPGRKMRLRPYAESRSHLAIPAAGNDGNAPATRSRSRLRPGVADIERSSLGEDPD